MSVRRGTDYDDTKASPPESITEIPEIVTTMDLSDYGMEQYREKVQRQATFTPTPVPTSVVKPSATTPIVTPITPDSEYIDTSRRMPQVLIPEPEPTPASAPTPVTPPTRQTTTPSGREIDYGAVKQTTTPSGREIDYGVVQPSIMEDYTRFEQKKQKSEKVVVPKLGDRPTAAPTQEGRGNLDVEAGLQTTLVNIAGEDYKKNSDAYFKFISDAGNAISIFDKVSANNEWDNYDWDKYTSEEHGTGMSAYKNDINDLKTNLEKSEVDWEKYNADYDTFVAEKADYINQLKTVAAVQAGMATSKAKEYIAHPLVSDKQALINYLVATGVVTSSPIEITQGPYKEGESPIYGPGSTLSLSVDPSTLNKEQVKDLEAVGFKFTSTKTPTFRQLAGTKGGTAGIVISEYEPAPFGVLESATVLSEQYIGQPLANAIDDIGRRIETTPQGFGKFTLATGYVLLSSLKGLAASATFVVAPDQWVGLVKSLATPVETAQKIISYVSTHPFQFVAEMPGYLVGGYLIGVAGGAAKVVLRKIPTAIANDIRTVLGTVAKKTPGLNTIYYAAKAKPNASMIEFEILTAEEKAMQNILKDVQLNYKVTELVRAQEWASVKVPIQDALKSTKAILGERVTNTLQNIATTVKSPLVIDITDQYGNIIKVGKVAFVTDRMAMALNTILKTHPNVQMTVDAFGNAVIDLKRLPKAVLPTFMKDIKNFLSKIGEDVKLVEFGPEGRSYLINNLKVVKPGSNIAAQLYDWTKATGKRIAEGDIKWLDTITQEQYDILIKDSASASKLYGTMGGASTDAGVAAKLFSTLVEQGVGDSLAGRVVATVVTAGPVEAATIANSYGLGAVVQSLILVNGAVLASSGKLTQYVNYKLPDAPTSEKNMVVNVLLTPTVPILDNRLPELRDESKKLIFNSLALETITKLIPDLSPKSKNLSIQFIETATLQDAIQRMIPDQVSSIVQDLTFDQFQDTLQRVDQVSQQLLYQQAINYYPPRLLLKLFPKDKDVRKEAIKKGLVYRFEVKFPEHTWIDIAETYEEALSKAMEAFDVKNPSVAQLRILPYSIE